MTEEEARKARNQYRGEWDKENTRRIRFKLNLRTDADILEKLDAEPNLAGYLKRLVREDIARNGK